MEKKFLLCILILFPLVFLTTVADNINEIKIESINFSYDDYSLTWKIKNYGNSTSFTLDVFFDSIKIYSSEYNLGKEEILEDIIYLGKNEKVTEEMNDCKEHTISIKISYEGKTFERKKTIKNRKYQDMSIEILPKPSDGRYTFGSLIEISAFDNNKNLIRNIEADLFLKKLDEQDYKKIKTLLPGDDGKIKIEPWRYSVGNYKVIIKQKREYAKDKFYCNKEINFTVKGRVEIRNLPYTSRIGEDVMLVVLTDTIYVSEEGIKGGRYYLKIENLEKKQSNILSFGSGLSTIVLNSSYFPNSGTYRITAYKDEKYWEDSKEILITDKPELEISVPENNEIGKKIDVKIDGSNIENLEVEIINPDGSITTYNKMEFSFIPTMSGEYEVIAKSLNHATTIKKFKVLDDMFLEIINNEQKIKVGEIIKFRVYDKYNNTLFPTIFVDDVAINLNQYMIKKIYTKVRVELENYWPIEKEIFAYGTIEIKLNKNNFIYPEKVKIYLETNPKTDCNIKILNKDKNEEINYRGKFYEFIPSYGNYEVLASNENYITTTKNFSVKKAKVDLNISYQLREVIIIAKSGGTGIDNLAIYIVSPTEKNLILVTNSSGIAKFKPEEGGKYRIIKIEKENFENIEKEIIIDVPSENFVVFLAIIGIILLSLFLLHFVKKVIKVPQKKINASEAMEKGTDESKRYEKVNETGGLIDLKE